VKVLILRLSSMGDIVLTSPVIRCLKSQVPGIQIHYLTKTGFASLVSDNPSVSRVHVYNNNMDEIIRELKNESFDLIIDLHRNLRTWRIKRSLGIRSLSFKKLNIRKWLLVAFKWNIMPKTHIVHRYMKACEPLGVVYDGKGLDFFFTQLSLPEHVELPAEPFVVYAIGGTYNTKKLPTSKVQELLNSVSHPIVIIGDQKDRQRVESGLILSSKHLNLCGRVSVTESALVMNKAIAVITHDTGMMHIAAALGKKIVSIWGNTVPELGMTPFYSDDADPDLSYISQVSGLSCRPCSKLGFDSCPKGHFACMQSQNIARIVEKLG
jgi:ADP-heptose:LPS heptosyltransferase